MQLPRGVSPQLLLIQLLPVFLLTSAAEATSQKPPLPHSPAELLAMAAARSPTSPPMTTATTRQPASRLSASEHMYRLYRLMRDDPHDLQLGPVDGAPDITGPVGSVISHSLIVESPEAMVATFNASSPETAELLAAVQLRLSRRGLGLDRRGRRLLAHRVIAHVCERHAGAGLLPAHANELAVQLDGHEFESCRKAGNGKVTVRLAVRPTTSDAVENWMPSASIHSRRRREIGEPPQLVTYHRSRQRREVRHSANRRRRREGGGGSGGSAKRRRRQSSSSQQLRHVSSDLSAVCQRRPLYVDFADIGWDSWIVAPQGFDAGSCAGQCPFPLSDIFNATNHAILQMTLHSSRPSRVNPPTCVPAKLRPKTLLYQGSHNEIVLKTFDEMEVEYCACR